MKIISQFQKEVQSVNNNIFGLFILLIKKIKLLVSLSFYQQLNIITLDFSSCLCMTIKKMSIKLLVLINDNLMCKFVLPGGGRNFITPRFLRHLNCMSINEFDDEAMVTIFTKILCWHFDTQ